MTLLSLITVSLSGWAGGAVVVLEAEQPAVSTDAVAFPFPRGKQKTAARPRGACAGWWVFWRERFTGPRDSMEAGNHEPVCISEEGFLCSVDGVD